MALFLITTVGVFGFFFFVTALICWVNVLTPAFHQSLILGTVSFLVPPIAFLWGWMKAKEQNLKTVMLVWTVCFIPGTVFLLMTPKIGGYLASIV